MPRRPGTPRPAQAQKILDPEREKRGNRCEARLKSLERCGARLSWNSFGRPSLEFAHVAPTPLVGRGRGSTARAYDIRRHPEAYKLVCRACHRKMDGLDERTRSGHWRSGPPAEEALPAWVTEGEGEEAGDGDVGRGAEGGE